MTNVLVIRGLFLFARHLFLCGEQAVCKTLRENAHYEVKYSALYFTWKLCRKCAKLLAKMLGI